MPKKCQRGVAKLDFPRPPKFYQIWMFHNKLKSLKVAKSKDDDGGVVDGSVDPGDVNGVLMLCVMVHVMVCVMVYVMVYVMVCVIVCVMVCVMV